MSSPPRQINRTSGINKLSITPFRMLSLAAVSVTSNEQSAPIAYVFSRRMSNSAVGPSKRSLSRLASIACTYDRPSNAISLSTLQYKSFVASSNGRIEHFCAFRIRHPNPHARITRIAPACSHSALTYICSPTAMSTIDRRHSGLNGMSSIAFSPAYSRRSALEHDPLKSSKPRSSRSIARASA